MRLRTPQSTELPPIPITAVKFNNWRRRLENPERWLRNLGRRMAWDEEEGQEVVTYHIPPMPLEELAAFQPKMAQEIADDLQFEAERDAYYAAHPEALEGEVRVMEEKVTGRRARRVRQPK